MKVNLMKANLFTLFFRKTSNCKKSSLVILALTSVMSLAFIYSAQAATVTWSSDGTSADWTSSTNWDGNTAPGITTASTPATMTNTDSAIFNLPVGTVGTDTNPVLIDSSTFNIGSINFIGNAGSYTIGTTNGNPIYFTGSSPTYGGGGGIYLQNLTGTSAVTETINGPIVMVQTLIGTQRETFLNSSVNGSGAKSGTLIINGNITATGNGNVTVWIRGTNTNANSVNGIISNGVDGTTVGLNKTDAGTWAVTGLNTFTGAASITQGILSINTIANTGSAQSLGKGTTAISLGQNSATAGVGELQYTGATASTNRAIQIANGASGGAGVIEVTSADTTLTLSGGITASAPASASSLTLQGAGNGVETGAIAGGALSLTKTGTGKWTLGGSNSYTGTTSVNAGTLAIAAGGSLANTAVTVATDATLQGAGTIVGPTTVNGTLLVGNDTTTTGTEEFAFGGDLIMNAGSKLELVLGADGAHTTLVLGGTYSFADNLTIDFLNIQAGTYTDIITGLSGDTNESTWKLSQALIDLGYSAVFSHDSDGSGIDVTITGVPEASTWSLLLLGTVVLFVVGRQRRRQRAC